MAEKRKVGQTHICPEDRHNLLTAAEDLVSALGALTVSDCAYVVTPGKNHPWGIFAQNEMESALRTILTALYGRKIARKVLKVIHKGGEYESVVTLVDHLNRAEDALFWSKHPDLAKVRDEVETEGIW